VANVDGRSGDQVLLAPPFIATEPEVETIVETLALAIDDALIEIGAALAEGRGGRTPFGLKPRGERAERSRCRRLPTAGLTALLRCRHQDLDQILSGQGGDTDAGPLRWIGAVHPLIPGAVHLRLATHVGDIHGGAEDA
jgi:hypothetical protein